MANYNRLQSETGRSPSPRIFGDLGKIRHDAEMGRCILISDDFGVTTEHVTATASGGYLTLQESSGLIQGQRSVADIGIQLGALQINTLTTDNAENHIQFGDGLAFRVDNAAGNTGQVGFECRLRANSIGNTFNIFVGLGGPVIAAGHIGDTGVFVAAGSFLGFRVNEDDGANVDTWYQAISQTLQTVLANATAWVANTYINLGFLYHPGSPDARQIRFYVNGVESNTYVTRTNMDAATFPEAEALHPMILTGGTGTNISFSVDWLHAYQYENEL